MKMKVGELGAFIRTQRNGAQMSLRKLSTLAGVSLPSTVTVRMAFFSGKSNDA